jgi:hypothetical protein
MESPAECPLKALSERAECLELENALLRQLTNEQDKYLEFLEYFIEDTNGLKIPERK